MHDDDARWLLLPGAPPKVASQRIPDYMAAVEPIVRPAVDAIDQPVRLSLKVGVPSGGDFLGANDLDNYLKPLCGYFGIAAKLAAVAATKQRGGHSMVRVDPFRPAPPPTGGGWLTAAVRAPSVGSAEQRAIARQLAPNVAGLPWGPVELALDISCGANRNWINLWKPLIDSLVPILGRQPHKSEFDIEDGRITSLALRRTVAPAAGNSIAITVYWRPLPGAPTAHAPTLDYAPGGPTPKSVSAPPQSTHSTGTRRGQIPDGTELIGTVERFRAIQAAGAGYVVNKDTTRKTMHVAGCAWLKETDFVLKTVTNRMRSGAYFHAHDRETIRQQWPQVKECDCR